MQEQFNRTGGFDHHKRAHSQVQSMKGSDENALIKLSGTQKPIVMNRQQVKLQIIENEKQAIREWANYKCSVD